MAAKTKHVHLMDGTPCTGKRHDAGNGIFWCDEHDRRSILRTDSRAISEEK